WRVVFVVWLAEGHFPTATSISDPSQLEEERRCFYVALTRARDELYLVHPVLAAPRDGERHILRPSRFLTELSDEPGLWETWNLAEEVEEESAPPRHPRVASSSRSPGVWSTRGRSRAAWRAASEAFGTGISFDSAGRDLHTPRRSRAMPSG